jgi:hypothetical protein
VETYPEKLNTASSSKNTAIDGDMHQESFIIRSESACFMQTLLHSIFCLPGLY